MSEAVIQIQGLEVSYGRGKVLDGVDLEVPAGSIFGFLGVNGAGKTTTIKTLMGLLRPDDGMCRILGLDVKKETMEIRRRVGYMAEDQRMYGWMTVGQIVDWVSRFYPQWDAAFSGHLLEVLDLPKKTKVKHLSKGQNSRLALLLALGHHPEVVILDDPTLGLDPIARKDFLRYVIGLLQSNKVTVFFSSHLLYEIEPVADCVAILHKGRIIKSAKTHQLRESVRRFVLADTENLDVKQFSGLLDATGNGQRMALTLERCDDAKRAAVKDCGATFVRETALNLDEIFEAYVIGNRGERIGA